MADQRSVSGLMAAMTTAEKLAQLRGLWLGFADEAVVAPEMDTASRDVSFEAGAADGLGQLTRVFGTAPISPRDGIAALLARQQWVASHTRWRIGVLAHEECLTGLAAWSATSFPTPLASAAAFDPALMRQMGQAIGATMASLGVHLGLAPVLDVARDPRWGRTEETMGEDPYVVATLGRDYIAGLQSQGVLACAKHFAGYSASTAARNLAPVHMGRRELDDVFLLPFQVAVQDAGVACVMPAYVEIDGLPLHANANLLTDVLRRQWGFSGTVLADYFGIAFLQRQHGVAATPAAAAALALSAGVDVELPSGDTFCDPALVSAVEADEQLSQALDQAVSRVLTQKQALGLLDIDGEIARLEGLLATAPESLDRSQHRRIAEQLANESVILLANDGVLPLVERPGLRIAVVGPNADRVEALFGCYSFINHVLMSHPGTPSGIEAVTVAEALGDEYPLAAISWAKGCEVRGDDRSGIAEAVALAEGSDVVVAVVGDQAGLFGRGTSGEGCDAESLDLPGVQTDLVEALLATGKPVVLVCLTGRPYAVGRFSERAAAILQAFFPGQMGGRAIAGVLSGRVNPSGRLPITVPPKAGALPYSYLHASLGDTNSVSTIDVTPQFCFGFGRSYTTFEYGQFAVSEAAETSGWFDVSVVVTNTGNVAGADVVQVYGHDVVASVTRPTKQLLCYQRVELAAGQSATVAFKVPTARFACTDVAMRRVVEPGDVEVWVGTDCDHRATAVARLRLTGPVALVTADTARLAVSNSGGSTRGLHHIVGGRSAGRQR